MSIVNSRGAFKGALSMAQDDHVPLPDLATLLDVDVDVLRAEFEVQEASDGDFIVPEAWAEAGRERIARANAAGAKSIPAIVRYLREAS